MNDTSIFLWSSTYSFQLFQQVFQLLKNLLICTSSFLVGEVSELSAKHAELRHSSKGDRTPLALLLLFKYS